jgi:glycosyltransferase involved in cell wall biosynthesis
MKVLVIAHKPPFPRIDGGCMATAQLISGLEQAGIPYHLAFIHTNKHPFNEAAFPPAIRKKIVCTKKIKTDGVAVNLKALRNSKHSIFTARFFDTSFAQDLIEYCEKEKPAIVHFESLFAAVYFDILKENTDSKFILRTHNIEHELWQERANASSFLKRWALRRQIAKLKKEELRILNALDGIMTIAKNEMEFISKNKIKVPAIWIPTGLEKAKAQSQYGNDFFHIGAMDWSPNRKAIQWFVKHVWSSYPEKEGNLLHLAGKGLIDDEFDELGIKNHGSVESSQVFMCGQGIMVVPLFEGSGLRIKIIEAGALGVPIIATTKAVEGIGLTAGEHYFEANNAEAFIGAMLLLSNDVSLRRKVGENLRQFVQENFDQNELNRKLIEFYRGI